MRPNVIYTFNINNLTKTTSLFDKGLQPLHCIYSPATEADPEITRENPNSNASQTFKLKSKWKRIGFNICYFTNNIRREKKSLNLKKDKMMSSFDAFVDKNNDSDSNDENDEGKEKETKNNRLIYIDNTNSKSQLKTVNYHTLTWSFMFDDIAKDDIVFFAHCYPFTFTDLEAYLKHLIIAQKNYMDTKAQPAHEPSTHINNLENENSPKNSNSSPEKLQNIEKNVPNPPTVDSSAPDLSNFPILKVFTLCYTPLGLPCYCLKITNNVLDDPMKDKKKKIFISSRIHPGESNSRFFFHFFQKFDNYF